ncbi:MAG: GIY-YIG nuclease family protein, partial [Calditrichaceae bacterium]
VPWVLPQESLWENPTLSAMYFAYILKSLRNGTYYYGSTSDLQERL